MNIKTEKVKMKEKTEEKGMSKAGKEYVNKALYVEYNGIVYKISFCNDYVFNKAEKEKNYILKYNITTNGRIELNDIEEIK